MFASKFTSHIWVNKKEVSQIDVLLLTSHDRNRMRALTTRRIICVVVTLAPFKSIFTINLISTTTIYNAKVITRPIIYK